MQDTHAFEYRCPSCGATNQFNLSPIRDMYQEHQEACAFCNKALSLVAADGIGGKINLIIDEIEPDQRIK